MFSAFTVRRPKQERAIKTKIIISSPYNNIKKEIIALWDTGATVSSINIKLVEELGLIPIGKSISNTANGQCEVFSYLINLKLPNSVNIPQLSVTGSNLGIIDMLIGMDVISRGQFTISADDNMLMASFVMPKLEMKDYIEDLKRNDRALFKKISRNAPCPCGSGKKYKNCCWDKHNR